MASMDERWLKIQFELYPEKSKADLARTLNLEPPAISKILGGIRQIKAPEYILMRAFFGLPSDGEKAAQPSSDAFIVDALSPQSQLHEEDSPSQWVIPAEIMQKRTDTGPEHIKSFRVEDNMMMPEFNRDEHVLVDLSDCSATPPGTFVVSDGFGFMLRNCEHIPNSEPVKIKITALKESFEPQKLTLDEFQIIGRVIAKLQWL